VYRHALELYRAVAVTEAAWAAVPTRAGQARQPHGARVRALTAGVVPLRERAVALLRDAVAHTALTPAELARLGFADAVVAAVHARLATPPEDAAGGAKGEPAGGPRC
jgi:hypothetical protein